MDLNRLRILAGLEPMNESEELNEVAPTDQEEFIKKSKPEFKKRYGKRWKEVLYATAWKNHNKESSNENFTTSDAIAKLMEIQDDAGVVSEASFGPAEQFFVYGRCQRKSVKVIAADMYKAVKAFAGTEIKKTSGDPIMSSSTNPVKFVDDNACEYISYILPKNEAFDLDAEHALIESKVGNNPVKTPPHDSEFPKVDFINGPTNALNVTNVEFNDDKIEYNKKMTGQDIESETKINVPSYVKSSIDKRIKELKDSIEVWDDKGYNQDGAIYKNAKHNALDVLEKFKALLDAKTVQSYKEAQVLYGTLMSPIFDLLPSQLINYLHNGHDEPKKKI